LDDEPGAVTTLFTFLVVAGAFGFATGASTRVGFGFETIETTLGFSGA
jgi:hypothetical protein